MTYERGFPNVSQPEPSQPVPAAALTFAGWTEDEARKRIRQLLAQRWSPSSIALMFGVAIEEIDRLSGEHDQPVSVCAGESC